MASGVFIACRKAPLTAHRSKVTINRRHQRLPAGRKPTHGRYAKAAITRQRGLRAMLRLLRAMIDETD